MLNKINKLMLDDDDDGSTDDSFFIAFGDVSMEMAQGIVEWIFKSNYTKDRPRILTLLLNSPGGDLHAAWAIIDVIRGSDIPVRIIGLGSLQSAGLLIFTSGIKGMRILTENTTIMCHQYYWGTEGKHHELVSAYKEVDLTQERLVKHFEKVTNLTREQINSILMPPTDVYLNAKEAKKYGLCDDIKTLK